MHRRTKLPIAPQCEVEAADVAENGSQIVYLVSDSRSECRNVVLVTFVDFRENRRPIGRRLVRFNRKEDAPDVSGNILLHTVGFYRKQERGDELDGAVSVDYSGAISKQLREAGMATQDTSVSAAAVLSQVYEPWIYCTSIAPTDGTTAGVLTRFFSGQKGTDASVAVIEDRAQFASQLGVDIALGIDVGRDTRMDGNQLIRKNGWETAFGIRSANALVEVFHGPVAYKDENLAVRKQSDLPGALKTCFTKRTRFVEEHEYRFAVFVGDAKVETIRLEVSSALADLMTCGYIGDGNWFLS